MDTGAVRKSDRKGGSSSSGAVAPPRRRIRRKGGGGGGGVLGKRRETSKPQDVEEEKQEPLPCAAEDALEVWKGFLQDISMSAEEFAAAIAKASSKPQRKETMEEREARMEEEAKAYRDKMGSEDDESWNAIQYRKFWNSVYSRYHGSYEDTTSIPPMRFTHEPALGRIADTLNTLQIFSVKVAATTGGLQWPLDVFGTVSMRDSVDRNRNVVFHCTRDNCQTLTEQGRNLVLVGPTRAVVLTMPEPVIIDVELKVKGTTESEDKDLSLLAVPLLCDDLCYSRVLYAGSYTSKLSTLEFRLGYIVSSVEATISVQVIRGSWPDGFCGQFAAFTTGVCCKDLACENNVASIDHEEILLLDSRGEKVAVSGDGKIELSRRVVCVEKTGELKVSVKAWEVDNNVVEKTKVFTPLQAGLSNGELDIGFCKLDVNVAWSLISEEPVFANLIL